MHRLAAHRLAAHRPALGRQVVSLVFLASLVVSLATRALASPSAIPAANPATSVAAGPAEPKPPRLSPVELAQDYTGAWSYKWGDSPRDENGVFLWLQAAAFTPLETPGPPRPPGRSGQQFLWLRTQLTGPEVHDATLYLEIVDQLFEAYLDGQLIHRYGDLDGARHFLGYPVHFVPLGEDYRGRTLTLRIHSEHINIGVSGRLRIGSKARLLTEALQQDVGKIFVGCVLCAIGLFVLVLFFTERREWAHLHYAVFALTVGMWVLCQMRVRTLLLPYPLAWLHVEIFSLYTTLGALTLFLSRALGRGPWGLMPILARIFVAYDLGAALLVATGLVRVLPTLLPFQLLLLASLVYTAITVIIGLRQGSFEARIFALGLSLSMIFVGYDLLMTLGVLPRIVLSMSYFGHGAFAVALGAILVHRFRLVHRDLLATKQALSDKVHALESRNAEVEHLNDELRRQIEARSKQLVSSLLGDSSGSQESVPIFAADSLLHERYRVLRTLGQGAMGVVYEVERLQDGRRFAAKVLSGHASRRDLARFAREAQVLAHLKHRNLVSIADVDVTDSRLAYIIMELVDGTTLADQASRYGDLTFVLPVLRQLADALATVHAEGVIHRDLKPANILIARGSRQDEPMIKIVDFGVSALNASGQATELEEAATLDSGKVVAGGLLTQTGVLMGTPLYMAPELLRGAKLARAAADVFSFGCIAYELLTGHLPSDTPPIMMRLKPRLRWYLPLAERCPTLPGPLAALLEQCLDAAPENRPAAAELRAALHALR